MDFWHSFDVAGGVGSQLLPLALGEIFLALLIGAAKPSARRGLRAATFMVVASILASLVITALAIGFPSLLPSLPIEVFGAAAEVAFLVGTILIWAVLLFRVLLPPLGLAPAPILSDTLLGLIFIAAAIGLVGKHGVNLSGIIATSAVLTGIIGFSLQDTLGNVMGGVSLQLERTIAVGDYIKVNDLEGRVTETRWRQTSIETFNADTIVIPNNVLTKSIVTVYGRTTSGGKTHRVNLSFNVGFSVSPETVIDVLERAFKSHSIANVAATPSPFCVLREFRDSSCVYTFCYFVEDPIRSARTSSDVQKRIFNALLRDGIEIAIPAHDLNVSVASRNRASVLKPEEMLGRLAVLDRAKLLATLVREERVVLASKLSRAPFSEGDIINYQGEEADYLYLLAKGEADVRVADGSGAPKHVALLREGDVFGEMGLMLGQPRSATVAAKSDVVCYRLNKEDFKQTLERRPEIADAISLLLAERKLELEGVLDGISDTNSLDIASTQSAILKRVRSFFLLH